MKLLQPLKGMAGIVLFRTVLPLLLLGLFSLQAAAQQTVSGKVTDAADGEPLIGVSIQVKGTGKGTITDFDGAYELPLSEGENTLLFTFIGYQSYEVTVDGQSVINMALEEDIIGLEEVTVTALGIEREKKALGYSVQDVSGDELSAANGSNFVSSLAGRAAGVQVVSSGVGPGQSASVVIRGASSLSSNNQPLFVVDGIPVNNDTDSRTNTNSIAGNMNIDYGNSGAEINPDDIASISVLKGANATALYGSRAANGAIIITTSSRYRVMVPLSPTA